MVRSWGYCKETSEKINLLFLPTGEVFNSLEEGEYGGFLVHLLEMQNINRL